jgi:hypothetical protein
MISQYKPYVSHYLYKIRTGKRFHIQTYQWLIKCFQNAYIRLIKTYIGLSLVSLLIYGVIISYDYIYVLKLLIY